MNMTRVLVHLAHDEIRVRICGRATQAQAQVLRDFWQRVQREERRYLSLDVSECPSMDSTFMGFLTMLSLELQPKGGSVTLFGAGDTVSRQLSDLGLNRFFTFENASGASWTDGTGCREAPSPAAPDPHLVLNAHETLEDVNPANVPKFKDVVEFLKQELDHRHDGDHASP